MNIYTFGLTVIGIFIGLYAPIDWILISLIPFGLLVYSLRGDGLDGIGAVIIGGLGFFLYIGASIGIGYNYINSAETVETVETKTEMVKKVKEVKGPSTLESIMTWKPFAKEEK